MVVNEEMYLYCIEVINEVIRKIKGIYIVSFKEFFIGLGF